MNYPFWEAPIGYGLMMGWIAVFHVFIAHFAIGGGLYLVITETVARNNNDQQTLGFLKKLSKFFILTTLVMGAVTGVGIWFIIGLLNPAATEVLIHNFVWAWAIEWTLFAIEIAAAIIYFYGWQTMSAKNHLIVGWIYFIAAWLSLFVINGIITFMLTPGDWIQTGNFWDAFFNPTFWPSLVFRTGICIMLAGFFALLLASRLGADDFKARLVRLNSLWGLIGLIVTIPSFYWYWKAIPVDLIAKTVSMMQIPIASISQGYGYAAAAACLLLFALIAPRRYNIAMAVLLMACGLMFFGKFEWFRESIRKPYVIGRYMFGNAVEVAHAKTYRLEGFLKYVTFRTGDDGEDLFDHACRSCHTIEGYRPLKPAFDGTDREFIAAMIRGSHVINGNMPPFLGTNEEADLLANYLYERIDKRPIGEIYGLEGVALGQKVYEIRCGKCHVVGGYDDKSSSLVGLGADGYNELLNMAADYGEEMPAFTGDAVERGALIEYLKTLEDKSQ